MAMRRPNCSSAAPTCATCWRRSSACRIAWRSRRKAAAPRWTSSSRCAPPSAEIGRLMALTEIRADRVLGPTDYPSLEVRVRGRRARAARRAVRQGRARSAGERPGTRGTRPMSLLVAGARRTPTARALIDAIDSLEGLRGFLAACTRLLAAGTRNRADALLCAVAAGLGRGDRAVHPGAQFPDRAHGAGRSAARAARRLSGAARATRKRSAPSSGSTSRSRRSSGSTW